MTGLLPNELEARLLGDLPGARIALRRLTDLVAVEQHEPFRIGIAVAPLALAEECACPFYQGARIGAGIAHQGIDFPANYAFAHDVGLDIIDGIDFKKGCYVGQEVVSRMKHRGTARRRPVIVSGLDAPAGSPVVANGREAGTIGQVVDGAAVAILRLDRITDPDAVTVDGKPVRVALPAWATYRFGDVVAEE